MHLTFILVLSPGNGHWGTWTQWRYCPKNSFVQRTKLRIEAYQGIFADDSGLNAIELNCFSRGATQNHMTS